jgi:serine/threonine protein kinase
LLNAKKKIANPKRKKEKHRDKNSFVLVSLSASAVDLPVEMEKKFCPRDLGKDFVVKEYLGAGAFGVVYRAVWFKGTVAVKFLNDRKMLESLQLSLGEFSTEPSMKDYLGTVQADSDEKIARFNAAYESLLSILTVLSKVSDASTKRAIFKATQDTQEALMAIKVLSLQETVLDASSVETMFEDNMRWTAEGLMRFQQFQASVMNEATILRDLPSHPNVVDFVGIILTPRPRLPGGGGGSASPMTTGASSAEIILAEYRDDNRLFFNVFDEDVPEPVIMTEFVDGVTLHKMMDDDPSRFNPAYVLRLMLGIARGMQHIHKRRVVHGDLASRNVLIEMGAGGMDRDVPKVTDFGLSVKMWNDCDAIEGPPRPVLTGSIANILPPEYYLSFLEPFKKLGSWGYNLQSDVWQFGLLLYDFDLFRYVPFTSVVPDPRNRKTFWKPIQTEGLLAIGVWADVRGEETPFAGKVPFPHKLRFRAPTRHSRLAELCLKPHPPDRPDFSEIVSYLRDDRALDKAAGTERPMPETVVEYGATNDDFVGADPGNASSGWSASGTYDEPEGELVTSW